MNRCWECGKPATSVCLGPHPGFVLRRRGVTSHHIEDVQDAHEAAEWEAIVQERDLRPMPTVLRTHSDRRTRELRRQVQADFLAKRRGQARGAA